MIILTSFDWTPGLNGDDIIWTAQNALRHADPGQTHLLVLPQATILEHVCDSHFAVDDLARLAKETNAYVGASAPVNPPGSHETIVMGWLISPAGVTLVQTRKSLPALSIGFDSCTADFDGDHAPAVADIPLANIGLVLGDDIFSPHIVRATVLAGAEIILNPAEERIDALSQMRDEARAARAYENICYVACTGVHAPKPGLYDFAGRAFLSPSEHQPYYVDIDVQELRRRRMEPFGNFLGVLRTDLYTLDYGKAARVAGDPVPQMREEWVEEGRKRAAESAPKERPADEITRYDVALMQTLLRNVPDPDHKDEVIAANLRASLEAARGWAFAPNVKLAVFPEFWLQGFVPLRGLDDWLKICITLPGPETDKLSEFAQATKTFVAGAAFEIDPQWPDRWFNTAFIIDDTGTMIHKYRKIQCGDVSGLMPNTTPGNILSAYLDKYGLDGLFPVADTKLGKLATLVCFDMNFPETARAMVRRGAEVIIHPTAEPHNTRRHGWDKARRTRAFENTAYILSAAVGGEFRNYSDVKPEFFHRGFSKIVKFDGSYEAVADGPGETALVGPVDLKALRAARANPLKNFVLWDDPLAYVDEYAQHEGYPCDVWLDTPMREAMEGIQETQKTIRRYTETDVFVAPND